MIKLPLIGIDVQDPVIENVKLLDHKGTVSCDCNSNNYIPEEFTLIETEVKRSIKGLLKCKKCGANYELKPDDMMSLLIKWPNGLTTKEVL